MDDEYLKESLAGFDALWQRVTGREPDRTDSAPAQDACPLGDALLALIGAETRAAAEAAVLARQCQGESRGMLQRQVSEARRRLRRLRAEYYILTGAEAVAETDFRPAGSRLACLRRAYLRAEHLAGQYEQAAALAGCGPLRDALAGFAGDAECAARQLRALLVDSF